MEELPAILFDTFILTNMSGLTHKISDSSLYLLHDMVEGMLQNVEHNLGEIPKEKVDEIGQLLLQAANYKQELEPFEKDIEEQRKQSFQFSIATSPML